MPVRSQYVCPIDGKNPNRCFPGSPTGTFADPDFPAPHVEVYENRRCPWLAPLPDQAAMPSNWSRRYKTNIEKIRSGDVYQVAEVVRNLSIREAEKGLSAGEKRMLAKARQILVSELALAERVEEDKAEILLDEVLAS